MRKPVYLLSFTFLDGSYAGYVYIDSIIKNNDYKNFNVKIQTSHSPDWQEIPVKKVTMERDGGTIDIKLASDEDKYQSIHLASPINPTGPSFITINNQRCVITFLSLAQLKLNEAGNPILDTLPPVKGPKKLYHYEDLTKAIGDVLKHYDVDCRTDIFEHTMLRLANISFRFNGYFRFEPSMRKPNHFYIDLSITESKARDFVAYFNQTYGDETAAYEPQFNRQGAHAICINLQIMMEKILPDFEKKVIETLSDEDIKRCYFKPFNELDKATQKLAKRKDPELDFLSSFLSANTSSGSIDAKPIELSLINFKI